MCALPLEADRPHASPAGRVIGCERVEVGARSALVRVTVAPGGVEPRRVAAAQLVILIDGTRERRQRALPSSADALADAGATFLTIGFAVTRRAEVVALEIGGRRLALPEPVVRAPSIVAPTAPTAAAPAPPALREVIEEQTRTLRARLAEAHAAAALLEAERDSARQSISRRLRACPAGRRRAPACARAAERGRSAVGYRRPRRRRAGCARAGRRAAA